MFLNETKPPLDEALAHYGVKGMKWGQRRAARQDAQEQQRISRQLEKDLFDDDFDNTRQKRIIAGTALAVVGIAATATILHKNGKLPLKYLLISSDPNKSFARETAENMWKKRKAKRPPKWTPTPGPDFDWSPPASKAAKDFIDAGFGKSGVFTVTTVAKGAKTVNNFGPDIWNVPLRALPSGRK